MCALNKISYLQLRVGLAVLISFQAVMVSSFVSVVLSVVVANSTVGWFSGWPEGNVRTLGNLLAWHLANEFKIKLMERFSL